MRRVGQFSLYLLASVGLTTSALAQDPVVDVSPAGPRFYYAASANTAPVRLDVKRTPVLSRRITLDLRDVTLEVALEEIRRQAGLKLMYSKRLISVEKKVSIKAEDITVAGALGEVLFAEEVDVMFSASAQAMLVPRNEVTAAIKVVGTVTGRVFDASTQEGVAGVRVSLEGTRWSTTTGSAGSYRLTGVAAGAYTLVTRRLGYKGFEQAVTVEDDREVTLDVTLQPVPSALNEVVVTATGEQRRVELGHVVGRINADSLVREAPISNISELLTARVPGLQVFQTQGVIGGRVGLQIRGPNSLSVSNKPIVVIDGVRYTTEDRQSLFASFGIGEAEPTSPLNDINPNDIESIEVIKGPSAATLYGTDAANGVIVVTTKRGRPGPARWNAYAKQGMTKKPEQHFPDKYWGWGTVNGVANNRLVSCTLTRLASRACTRQDSVTVLPNPLNDPEFTIFANKPRWEYGTNVAGGSQNLRYYFSGDFEDATGPVQLPRASAERLRQQRGGELPKEWREPNAFTKLNLRSNVTAVLTDKADLQLNVGYVRSDTRTLSQVSDPYRAAHIDAKPGEVSPYGFTFFDPVNQFTQTMTEAVDRFVGSGSGHWRPTSWLATRGSFGLDLSHGNNVYLARRGDQPGNFVTELGVAEDSRSQQKAITADVGATATARLRHASARTSVGAQYVRNLYTASGSLGMDLPAGARVAQRGAQIFTKQLHNETAVLGGYVEEMLGFNERLFVTGALRFDGASTFGRDFDVVTYPKMGASWLLSEERLFPRLPGIGELRLRYAFGASGNQPNPRSARMNLGAGFTDLNGTRVQTVRITGFGNPVLRPERVREHEFGGDATALSSRLTVGVTWFRRRTKDQLVNEIGPPGRGSILTNLGLTTQRGFEGQVEAQVLETPGLRWNITLLHSEYTTELVDIGSASMLRSVSGGYVEGYPLGARFAQRITGWTDANGDGILASSELQRTDSAVYAGQSVPPRAQTLSSYFAMLGGRLRLSAVFERKSGFTQIYALSCRSDSCRAAVDPATPLAEQLIRFEGSIPVPADFTRLRETTIAVDLPTRLTSRLGVSRTTLAISGRNLALWTRFSGPDPEVGPTRVTPTDNPSGVTNQSAEGFPHGRVFSIRLDVGF